MAAGRHGGYRDNEFRDREADIGMSRKGIMFPKGACNLIRNGGDMEHEKDQGWSRDHLRSKGRIGPKEMRGTVTNGRDEYHSTFGLSGAGCRSCNLVVSNMDREPGEVFSDGSEEGLHLEVQYDKGIELWKLEHGDQMSHMHNKKRKFSPIVWDRNDGDINRTVKSKTISETNNLPCQPPVLNCYRPSPTFNPSCSERPTDFREVDFSEESRIGLSTKLLDSPSETYSLPVWSDFQEAGEIKNDNVPTACAMISSRWANDADSPAGEGEISGEEYMLKYKRKFVSESAEAKGPRTSSSSELWELKREGFDGMVGRSSVSGKQVRSSSRDCYHGITNKNDDIEVAADQIRNYDDIGVSHSETESEDDLGSRGTPEPAPQRSFNMLQGCRNVDEFERLNKIDEGTYGVVFRARDKKTGEVVALKKVKMEKEREGFPLTSLREINILLSCHHPFIVDVKEVVVGSNLDSIFMVMEYMEHDLKGLIETMKQPFSQSEVKCLMLQLIGGVKYLHDNWVLHRDLKTSNLLLNNRGELKICDFGLARQYGSPLKQYTQLVVTLWYRAPELLLGAKQYSTAIDMWSLGCIMAELLSKEPLFNGNTEVQQLDKIFKILGTPTETIWPGFSKLPGVKKVNFAKNEYNLLRRKFPATSFTGSLVLSDAGFDLLRKLLTYDPDKRITAAEALNHPWFHEVPLPKSKEFMPTFPAQHAQDRRMRRVMKSPDPLKEQMKELRQGELGTGTLLIWWTNISVTAQESDTVDLSSLVLLSLAMTL
ncbi:cyclin-dependent kinase G-2-like [Henckelia pumila]|uniref:cyclin-dependent kinase G-2-like n=1 Tax=Henckelia pumila TaxID=405737 RepID=UPI003C6E6AE5